MQQPAIYRLHISRTVRPILVAVAFMLLLPSVMLAQQPDERTTGTSYVLAFPDTVTNTFDARYPNRMGDKLFIYIYSAVNDNRITITGSGYDRVLTGEAGKFTIVELTDSTYKAPTPIVTESGKASKNTFRVEAQQPIVVYCYMVTKFGCAAWTPIPVEFWGSEYYAQSLPGEPVNDIAPAGQYNYSSKRQMAPAEIVVVAAEDNTLVTFVPSANSRLLHNPQVNAVKLNRNEAYQIQSYVDTTDQVEPADQPDLAGIYITASKPIGVLSGNTRAMVINEAAGLGKNSFKDMMMEWVAPVEQHGLQFVYMPTMDARRPKGIPGEVPSEKRLAEIVRLYATKQATNGTVSDPDSGATTDYTIGNPSQFYQQRVAVPKTVVFKTDQPAQAFMNTSAVVKFLGTTGGVGGHVGSKFDAWGTYSVEMVAREQWINSAPYFAPLHPSNMEHFINIVTDTASAKKIYWGTAGSAPTNPVLLNKLIPGTDLVWGTMVVNPGLDLFITGWDTKSVKPDTRVRFYAFVYGFDKGHEEYRPGMTGKKDEGGSGIASGGKGNEVLGPAEYEEYLAVAYGYPLAPARADLRSGELLPRLSAPSHLDFGQLRLTESDTLQLHICNAGGGTISFNNPAGGDVITGLGTRFRVDPTGMNMLTSTVLGPGGCMDVPVMFVGTDQPGYYGAQAILWSNPGPDTISLSATVLNLPLGVETVVEAGTALTSIDPNPVHGTTRIEFTLATAGHATLEIFDISGRRVATPVDGTMQAGVHAATWDASHLPAGTYYCRLTVGEWNSTQPVVVR